MTDPNAYVTGELAQQAAQVQGAAASEQDIAQAAQSSAGLGVTEADIDAIRQRLASFEALLNSQIKAQQQQSPDILTQSVAALTANLQGHGDPAALQLADDAAEAARSAVAGGSTGPLGNIVQRIGAHLRANHPGPGENFHYRNAIAAADDFPNIIARVTPAEETVPGKVLAGSVVG